jgi:hypothetical protein
VTPARVRTVIPARCSASCSRAIEGEEPYPISAGQAFWEPGFDVVHSQAANLRADIASRFVVFMLCAPDVPMMTFLDGDEIKARAHLRCFT